LPIVRAFRRVEGSIVPSGRKAVNHVSTRVTLVGYDKRLNAAAVVGDALEFDGKAD